jgi:hypothetical protein
MGKPAWLREVRDFESIMDLLPQAPFPIFVVELAYAQRGIIDLLKSVAYQEALVVLVGPLGSDDTLASASMAGVTAWFDRPPSRSEWMILLPRYIEYQQDRMRY